MLSTFIMNPLGAMQEQSFVSRCSLDTVFYKLISQWGRNDYLYLASSNSVWFFKKKLASQENVQDIDRYYLTVQLIADKKSINFYQTPLHAAIERGNVRAVSLLLSLGADKNKRITVRPNKKDIAYESGSYSVMVSVLMTSDEKLNQKRIAEFKDSLSVDLSAVELAQKLLKQEKEADICVRKKIYELLEK